MRWIGPPVMYPPWDSRAGASALGQYCGFPCLRAELPVFWSPHYVQHSAHIEPGRDGLFNLIKSMPPTFKHEHEQIVADGDLVIVHSRFSGFGQAKNWIVADFVRVVDGILIEHWDVVEDEASQVESKSGRPMFGDRFPG